VNIIFRWKDPNHSLRKDKRTLLTKIPAVVYFENVYFPISILKPPQSKKIRELVEE
jgi:hypothetical protein